MMPISIGRYSAQVKAPDRSGMVAIEHPEYLTAGINQGLGKIIQSAGKEGTDILNMYEAKKEEARKTVELANFNTNLYTKKAEWEESIKSRDDYQNFDSDFKEYAQKAKDELLTPITNETDKKVYEAHLNKELTMLAINTSKVKDQKMFRQQENNYYGHIVPSFEKIVEQEQDPVLRQGYIDQFKDLTEQYMASIYLPRNRVWHNKRLLPLKQT
jgi:hypothetical protein